MAVSKGEFTQSSFKNELPIRGVLLELEYLLEALIASTKKRISQGNSNDSLQHRLSWMLRSVEETVIELRKAWSDICVSDIARQDGTREACLSDAGKCVLKAQENLQKFSEFLSFVTWPTTDIIETR